MPNIINSSCSHIKTLTLYCPPPPRGIFCFHRLYRQCSRQNTFKEIERNDNTSSGNVHFSTSAQSLVRGSYCCRNEALLHLHASYLHPQGSRVRYWLSGWVLMREIVWFFSSVRLGDGSPGQLSVNLAWLVTNSIKYMSLWKRMWVQPWLFSGNSTICTVYLSIFMLLTTQPLICYSAVEKESLTFPRLYIICVARCSIRITWGFASLKWAHQCLRHRHHLLHM